MGDTSSITTGGAVLVKATGDNDAITDSDAGSGGIVGIAGSSLQAIVGLTSSTGTSGARGTQVFRGA